jgi:Predicted membrane protein
MSKNSTKKLAFSAVAIALALVTSRFKLFAMPLGGSITLFSMLFIALIGYWFGPVHGIIGGITYGLLRYSISSSSMLNIAQLLLDYPLAFAALACGGGLFKDKKLGLQLGYITGVFGRFIFATLSGVLFFAANAPEGMNGWIYSILYNGSYLAVEAAFTLILISLPQVTNALNRVKTMSQER